MNSNERWRLPDGVEELLPAAARQLEQLRTRLTDLHFQWGYELVIPPLVEFLDSLLTGSGELMDLQTFKLVDQMSGKMMGVRADMTPQVARIDAHLINSDDVTRLFYMGSVLRTLPDLPGGSRSPLQLGAEIYGHAGVESDIEIILLMLETVSLAGVTDPFLDLGHVGVYRGLVEHAGLNEAQEAQLFDCMQRKSQPDITAFLSTIDISSVDRNLLTDLTQLNGGVEVIKVAREKLQPAGAPVQAALDSLMQIADDIRGCTDSTELHVDLAELRGYSYHTGVVYSVYASDHGQEIARGGRYDDIGAAFGKARYATGYSADLKELRQIAERVHGFEQTRGIFVQDMALAGVRREVGRLRLQGERVVTRLPGSNMSAKSVGCDRNLVSRDGNLSVEPV